MNKTEVIDLGRVMIKKKNKKTNKNNSGVVSLEACIVLPIFFFLIMFFYGFMFLFAGEQIVNHALIQSAVSLSLDSYSVYKLEGLTNVDEMLLKALDYVMQGDETPHSSREKWYSNQSDTQKEVRKRFVSYVANGDEEYASEKLEQFGIVGGLDGISFSECKVEGSGRDSVLTITIEYEQEYIMDAFGLLSYDRKKTITQKMWEGEKYEF